MVKRGIFLLIGVGVLVAVGVLAWAQLQPPILVQVGDVECVAQPYSDQDTVGRDARERLLIQLEANKQGFVLAIPDAQALQPIEFQLPPTTQGGTCAP